MSDVNEGKESAEKIFGSNSEFNRFGLISAILLIVGCTGGLAMLAGAVESLIATILIVIPTMTTLSLLLAVAPMRYVLTTGIVATIINVLFIAYFLIA